MMRHIFKNIPFLAAHDAHDAPRLASLAGLAGVMLAINFLILHNIDFGIYDEHSRQLLISMNAALVSFYLLVHWRYAAPLKRLVQMVHHTNHLLGHVPGPVVTSPRHAGALVKQMAAMVALVHEQSEKRRELLGELESVRMVLAQCTQQQDLFVHSTNREIITQYQAVLGYANYLDDHITQHANDDQLRLDFDDVCESSFNLKLIAGSLDILRSDAAPSVESVPLALLMQQTMLALAPSLDRRVMKLTTQEVDESVIARSDPVILTHVIWTMLLGLIRYAAEESTLRMRCLYDRERQRALLSIVVSELAPGHMTPNERAAHMIRQLQHVNPHMFADTIKIHGNIKLAELLLGRLDASIEVVPLSAYACEICLTLPAGE